MSDQYCWTLTCGDGDTLAGGAGAVLVSGLDHRSVLLLAAQIRDGAVAGGGVACAHVPVLRRGNDTVGRSDGGGAPRHQSAVFFAGGLGGHVYGWTRFCEERMAKFTVSVRLFHMLQLEDAVIENTDLLGFILWHREAHCCYIAKKMAY